jgi:hypothetical protein
MPLTIVVIEATERMPITIPRRVKADLNLCLRSAAEDILSRSMKVILSLGLL